MREVMSIEFEEAVKEGREREGRKKCMRMSCVCACVCFKVYFSVLCLPSFTPIFTHFLAALPGLTFMTYNLITPPNKKNVGSNEKG